MVRVLVAVACALALADASVVTLALPDVYAEFGSSVEAVAAVIGVYTLALAAAALPAVRLARLLGARGLAAGGSVLFAAASLGCGLADTMPVLIALRALQAVGAAGVLVGGFALLGPGRLWTAAAIFGTAAGPALGGALTQAFDWRAIFLAQVPVALAAALAALRATVSVAHPGHGGVSATLTGSGRAAVALALLSAALTAVLFLLVLLLVSGWSVEPLAAAATVTVLPLAALAGNRVGWAARERAAAGCALVGSGVLSLAFLPTANVVWTLAPQIVAGVGMGMALPALAGGLLPERGLGESARLLAFRHAGVTVALAVLAPITSAQLDASIARTQERGAAIVLDAAISPVQKIRLAGAVVQDLDPIDPRDQLRESMQGADVPDELVERADDALVAGVADAFEPALLIAGALGLLAALVLWPARRALVLAAASLLLPVAGALAEPRLAPPPVEIRNPCHERELPDIGGVSGVVHDAALIALDRAACRFGSSREELAIALTSPFTAAAYAQRHGVDPRDLRDLLGGILGPPFG